MKRIEIQHPVTSVEVCSIITKLLTKSERDKPQKNDTQREKSCIILYFCTLFYNDQNLSKNVCHVPCSIYGL